MELCERLKALRCEKGITKKELSGRLGVSVVSVGHWETGAKNPSMSAIISLSKIFGVTTDFLLGVSAEQEREELLLSKNEKTLLTNYRILDRYGKRVVDAVCTIEKNRVEAEQGKRSEKPHIFETKKEDGRCIPLYSMPSAAGYSVPFDNDDFEMIPVEGGVPADADFAVNIQGTSMLPYICDGDTVYVKRDVELSVGDVGIFSVDGAMYCKQYYIDDERNLTLVSANPDLKDSNVHVTADSGSDVRCYGKVLLGYKVELPDYLFE